MLHLSGIIIVRSVLRQSEVAAPSLKTYCFACTRRQLLKNLAFHVHGSADIYTGRDTYFPAARNCTHFDAEVRTFFFTFCGEQPISERMQFLRSWLQLAVLAQVPTGATPSLKTYGFACTRTQILENWASRLHGNTNLLADRAEYFPAARNCTHFDAEGRQ